MGILRWEWTLANRGTVAAAVDVERGIESISQAGRLLSEAPRGSRPEGHVVLVEPRRDPEGSERPPIEAVVTFDPTLPICILRVDGHDVAPAVWPVRQRHAPPPPASPAWQNHLMLVALAATIVAFCVLAVRRFTASADAKPLGKLAGTYRAPNGRFIAHFPEDLEARAAVLPSGLSGVILEDKAKTTTIVIAAQPSEAIAHDAWSLQQRLRDEVLANVPKGTARFEEGARSDEVCIGKQGAVVTGALALKGSKEGHVWSCAFEHDGAGYFVTYALPGPENEAASARARAVIEATELTHLAELGTSAP